MVGLPVRITNPGNSCCPRKNRNKTKAAVRASLLVGYTLG